ncbi:MAG TPA: alpha/beta fold hydrolase [Aliidongia sp.]|nr:alpha/beta fold hydrolase [Aliidongia sp.]
MRLLLLAFVLCVPIGLGATWIAGSTMIRGRPSAVTSAERPAQDVAIETRDGLLIAGTFRPGRTDRSPAVLLLHGLGASRSATAPNAAWLAGLGYATLTIDFRGHGQSAMAARSFGLNEAMDARAALAWLKHRQHGGHVGVIGISLGGAASLIGVDGPIPADALVLQAVYPDIRRAIRNRIADRLGKGPAYLLEPLLSFQAPIRFGVSPSGLSPLEALARYAGPVLVIGGMQDRSTLPEETRSMFEAVQGKRELWLVADGDHGAICALADVPYRSHVEAFMRQTIGPPD